eukprot:2165455-Prymnesium_polylepis.1
MLGCRNGRSTWRGSVPYAYASAGPHAPRNENVLRSPVLLAPHPAATMSHAPKKTTCAMPCRLENDFLQQQGPQWRGAQRRTKRPPAPTRANRDRMLRTPTRETLCPALPTRRTRTTRAL